MRAQVADGTSGSSAMLWRLRAVAICVALTALAFIQDPGITVIDTKVDLSINPAGWLERALHLWTPEITFGQLQNQAYGYLWPMGPFFLAGTWIGLPGWVIQRLWWALLMCVAFTGTVKLAGRLGMGTPASRLIAGAAFALSPRILTQLGMQSIESWPTALAPWVLIPLIGLAKGEPLRRCVALSALAAACAGGVNATAVFAVVPLPLLWLATLEPVRHRLTAIAAWCGAVFCACAWWLLPLLVLGSYSPPFLDYIESAEVTTRPTDIVSNLRGASFWLAYLRTPFGPVLPAGWRLAAEPIIIIATMAVAAFGLVGLSRRGTPHRRFLLTGFMLGLGLIAIGHVGKLDGGLGQLGREFLDGAGAPLRNVHKFDVLVRLPLALGLASFVGILGRAGNIARGPFRPMRAPTMIATGTAVVALVGVASPALAGGLAPTGGFRNIPSYWQEAADWLKAQEGGQRVLVVPGARFPHYRWGRATDEITQPLLDTPWAVRNAIPITPPATIRMLDAVDAVLATGAGSTGLADFLARAGVRYVLLRSDLDYGRSETTRPLVARQAIERSPGLVPVAGFGPVASTARLPDIYIDDGLDVPLQALELYRVDRPVAQVVAYDVGDVTTVVGGPESLLELNATGQLSPAPTVLAGDLEGRVPTGKVVVTDGMRRRDVAFGAIQDNVSATMTANERYATSAPAHDYLPSWGDQLATTVRYDGISDVTASTSWERNSDLGGRRPEYQPFAALDGDNKTSWRSAPGTRAGGQWLEVTLGVPQTVSEVTLRFDVAAQAVPAKVTVVAGIERTTADVFAETATIRLPGLHATRAVRVIVDSVYGTWDGRGTVGIAELTIPSLRATRTLVVPAAPVTTGPMSMVFSAASATPACYFISDQPKCSPEVARGSEDGSVIDRTVQVPVGGSYTLGAWARPRPGAALDALLDSSMRTSGTPSVSASSSKVADPAGRAGVVVDGDPTTAWSPAAGDSNPLLRLTWPSPREITSVRLTTSPAVAASQVRLIRVIGDSGFRDGFLGADGSIRLDPPLRTTELTVLFLDRPTALSFDLYTNTARQLPIAVGELVALPGPANRTADLDRRVDLPCGSGPTLRVGDATRATRLVATIRDLLELREVPAELCTAPTAAQLPVAAGELRVVASASDVATATRVRLDPAGTAKAPTGTEVRVESWSASKRRLDLDAHPVDRVLAVRENTNPGWRASMAGQVLEPIVVDGWQQGWLVPAGASGEVVLEFTPDAPYRMGLLAGCLLLLGVALAAFLPMRRRGAHESQQRLEVPARTRDGRTLLLVVGGLALIVMGGVLGGAFALAGISAVGLGAIQPYPVGIRGRLLRRRLRVLESWAPVGLFVVASVVWLSTTDAREAAGPQFLGLLAVAVVWLSATFRFAPVPAESPPHDGALQQVVTQRSEEQGYAEGKTERADGISGEGQPVLRVVDHLEDDELPQEESVRHGS